MKKSILLLAFFLTGPFILVFSSAEAQGTKNAATQQTAIPRKRVAVLDLKARDGVSESIAALLSDNLRSTLFEFDTFDILNREDMDSIFKEIKFQASGACDTSCVVEAGMALGVQKMVAGSIGKVGEMYAISLRVVDIEKAKNEVILTEQYVGSENSLPSFVSTVADKLADRAMRVWSKDEGWSYKPRRRSKVLKKKISYREKRHKPVLAGALGILPGVGQIYNKQKLKGIALSAVWVGAIALMAISDRQVKKAVRSYDNAARFSDFDPLVSNYESAYGRNKLASTAVLSLPLLSSLDAFLFGKKKAKKEQ